MKRILFLFSTVLCLGACSVDDQELENASLEIQEINATFDSNGCIVTSFNYGSLGNIEVRNDKEFLYISINATGNNTLASTALHIVNNTSEFPNGNFPINKMQHQVTLSAGTKQHTFKFPLSNYNENFFIASNTTFGNKSSFWAGDIAVKQGNWAYFNYEVTKSVDAGPDSSISITESEVRRIGDIGWDEIRKLFANQLAPGVDSSSGTYDPSIWDLINDFNSRENVLGDYTTTYTLGSGNCTDSVVLTVTVIADDSK